jgi:hypothetical protein
LLPPLPSCTSSAASTAPTTTSAAAAGAQSLPRRRGCGGAELSEPGSGLDPELLHEQLARSPEELERVGLPAGAVEREHQQLARPLAQRLLPHEALELGDGGRGPAGIDRRVQPVFVCREP